MAVLGISLVMVVVAVSSLNVALPTIFEALKPDATEQLWILESYALVFAFLLLPAGALGDKFGRKKALLTGLAIFATGALLASLSRSAIQVILCRSFMAVGAALIMPATLSIITNVFPPQERQKAIATWAGLAGAGGAIGPLTSGLVLRFGDWPKVFLINVPIAALLAVLVWRFVPDSKDPDGHPLDPVGVLFSILGIGGLVYAIIQGPDSGWASGRTLLTFAVAFLGLAAFIWWELKAEFPMLDPRLFKLPGFSMGALTITLQFFGMFGMFFLISQYLQFVKGYSPLVAGLGTMPSAVTMVIVSPRSGLLAARMGVRATMHIGFGLIAAGFVIFGFLRPESHYVMVAIGLVVLAAGMALVMAPASGSIVSSLPPAKAGVGSAVNDVTREVGGAMGIATLGTIVSTVYRPEMTDSIAKLPVIGSAGHSTDSAVVQMRELLVDSIAKAEIVVHHVPAAYGGPKGKVATTLHDLASHAYTHSMSWAFHGAALVAVIAGLIVGAKIPDKLVEHH